MDTKHAPPQDAGILGDAGTNAALPPSYGATTTASHHQPAYTDNNTTTYHNDTVTPRAYSTTNSNTAVENTASDLLLLLMAILLPPVAVFLKKGCGAQFLINVLLCILGWLPGVLHAFYVVLRYPGDSGRVSSRRGI
ncbi:putative plasma membrane proteolipid 3 [Cladorrhinum sp. PSN332]|nr:putative plasma membrane proteolipid 3 [Cladorrhinum sp. PSN332]